MLEMRNAYKILVGVPEEKDQLRKLSVGLNGRLILKWILKQWDVRMW
jgi:hypothetical protein